MFSWPAPAAADSGEGSEVARFTDSSRQAARYRAGRVLPLTRAQGVLMAGAADG